MPITKKEFALAVQHALPQAKVFWETPPDSFFTESPCALTAVSNADPNKKFTMNMPNGVGAEPLDDVVETFITYFNSFE